LPVQIIVSVLSIGRPSILGSGKFSILYNGDLHKSSKPAGSVAFSFLRKVFSEKTKAQKKKTANLKGLISVIKNGRFLCRLV
ncbi:MAG: hypothetical protein II354_05370, partial [Firmicutes bacterium]|nr:hypothetical protein [Bacillota bacterium]